MRVRELLERLGIDESELDDRDERQLDLLYELAAANASEEVMRALGPFTMMAMTFWFRSREDSATG